MKVSIRYSEFEKLENYSYLFKYIKWIWIDHLLNFPLNKNFIEY